MEIKLCDNRAGWDNWFKKQGQNEFLQSWDWGEFQESTGKPALRLQAVEGGEVRWQGQGFVHGLGMGMKYLYLPRMQNANFKMQNIVEFAKRQRFVFLRIESLKKNILQSAICNLQFTKSRQPQTTLILDLTQPEETLLANMHSKTRYNISLAERKGVQVKNEKDVNVFWTLNQATTKRDEFKSHGKEYYAKMLQYDFTHQLTAYYNNIQIATILLVVFGDTCVYLHGASSNEERNLMAPYLLQWRGIKLAKKLGCRAYDFWGISPAPQAGEASTCFHNLCWEVEHRWTGVTRFKAGFGGVVREYPQAVDVVLNKGKYLTYLTFKRVLGILKGLRLNH